MQQCIIEFKPHAEVKCMTAIVLKQTYMKNTVTSVLYTCAVGLYHLSIGYQR